MLLYFTLESTKLGDRQFPVYLRTSYFLGISLRSVKSAKKKREKKKDIQGNQKLQKKIFKAAVESQELS